jgi:hypothetical protein
MIKVIEHQVVGDFELPYRTEDVRFSPSGQRLAVVATDGCVIFYAVDITVRPIALKPEVEVRSASLLVPHGIEFLTETLFVVANRNSNLAFFHMPPPEQWHASCNIEAVLEVGSPLFGGTGVTRNLRDRALFCGPGSVRLFDGVLYVCCNYKNTVSTFGVTLEGGQIKVASGSVIAQQGLEVVDGIGLSEDGQFMALSDHDHQRVAVYRRTEYHSKLNPTYELVCSLRDCDMHFAHGLRFGRDSQVLYVADAGGRYIHVFKTDDQWQTDLSSSTFKTLGVDEEAFIKSQEVAAEAHRLLEGGAKGLDIGPDYHTIALTCRNQILRFIEIEDEAKPAFSANQALSAVDQPASIALSCLIDDTPAIWRSIVPWLASATLLAGIKPNDLYLHHVCELPAELLQLCRKLGVQTRAVEPFHAANPHTNKIMQGATQFVAAKTVVLTDVDVVFTGAVPFDQIQGLIAGKTVDQPNPPLHILQKVFDAAGITILGICTNQYVANGACVNFDTLIGNFNGGMYVLPANILERLTERWRYWAYWLIDRIVLLEKWGKHADQVGFCLAISEMKVPLRILDNRWNYPVHLPQPGMQTVPWVLHHHAQLDESGLLLPVANPIAQCQVHSINTAICRFRRMHGL